MSKQLNEFVPALAAIAGELAGAEVAATAGEGLAGRLAAGAASKAVSNKVEDILSKKGENETEEAGESCECKENGEEAGCDCCRQKVVQKKRDLGTLKNKYNIEMKERIEIVKFLKHLNEKNYAEAHKYLKNIMDAKLQKRIAANKGVKVF
jgi:hypothetical protein